MNKDYTDVITKVCELLFHAIGSRESNLEDKVQSLDGEIFKLWSKIGLQLMSVTQRRKDSEEWGKDGAIPQEERN
ncbi:MAG: hypothetical protein GDA44_00875 [Prochloron sp. SP5CPC1]|nr:hypothetical protein [Candidatus Paraprochloron terpiosi SP5CPC1]